jgi:hypothetical protein
VYAACTLLLPTTLHAAAGVTVRSRYSHRACPFAGLPAARAASGPVPPRLVHVARVLMSYAWCMHALRVWHAAGLARSPAGVPYCSLYQSLPSHSRSRVWLARPRPAQSSAGPIKGGEGGVRGSRLLTLLRVSAMRVRCLLRVPRSYPLTCTPAHKVALVYIRAARMLARRSSRSDARPLARPVTRHRAQAYISVHTLVCMLAV